MTVTDRPFRAVLNFTHHCALRCEWCYVPFDARPPNKQFVASIIRRIAELGFKSLTIGGGDPFQYHFLPELLRLARSLRLFVHVDTHAKGLRESTEGLEMIRECVDLLGLPLDGPSLDIHDAMRMSPGHFSLIMSRMAWLKPLRDKVKLNTFVSAKNAHYLTDISRVVSAYSPARWSIYQYWPLGPAQKVSKIHTLSDSDFVDAVDRARHFFDSCSTTIEVNLGELKRNTYPIINHDGEVFVQTSSPVNEIVSLGSLFDEDVLERIFYSCLPERGNAATRYVNSDSYSKRGVVGKSL